MENRYTCQEVANLYHVKIGTVWSWIRNKKLSGIKVGKQYIVRQCDLEQFEQERQTVGDDLLKEKRER